MRNILVIVAVISIHGYSQTGPGGIGTNDGTSNLDIWLRADAGVEYEEDVLANDNDTVTYWRDQSGNGHDFDQPFAGSRPEFDTTGIGGRPAICFASSNSEFLSEEYTFGDDVQVFIVAQSTSTNWNNQGFMLSARGLNGIMFHPNISTKNMRYYAVSSTGVFTSLGTISAPSITEPNLYDMSVDHNAGIIDYFIGRNGSESVGSYSANRTSSLRTISLGKDLCCRYLNGKIAEIILYNEVVNEAQKIIINNYLAAKYGISLSLNDLYNEDDAAAGDYDLDVAGIGRIDASNLHDDSKGTGVVRILNPAGMGDDEFLLWGHDNGILQAIDFTDVPGPVEARFERVWRASEVNTSGAAIDVGAVDVRFDLTDLGPVTASDLRLLVDTDNDGLFIDEAAISGAVSVGSGEYEFAGITEIEDNLRFTLGTISNPQTPLPIELINFNVEAYNEGFVRLEWEMASESNNDYFTIERSKNGTQWEELSRIESAGNSSEVLSYESFDLAPISGISYYRLKQTDFNGVDSYSPVKSCEFNGRLNQVSIHYDFGENKIILEGDESEFNSLYIYNALGQNMISDVRISKSVETRLVLDVAGLNSGLYFVVTKTTSNRIWGLYTCWDK